jgi:ElaB/YqjD/DUF883 family membrane-anchored ribosome-binding protein
MDHGGQPRLQPGSRRSDSGTSQLTERSSNDHGIEESIMRNGSALRSPLKDLRNDLKVVARDTEALLKATAEVTSERVQEARARTEKSLREVLDNVYDRKVQRRVRRMARTTDTYVRDHSWSLIGAVAGIALLVGLLARRD